VGGRTVENVISERAWSGELARRRVGGELSAQLSDFESACVCGKHASE
jgi:hypothetical protein